MLQAKLILTPVDFSDSALDAVETAADLASRLGAVLLLVHIVPALPKLPADVSIFKEGEYEQRLHEHAVGRIAELAARYEQTGISVRSEVGVANDVGMEILRVAKKHEADLIVIATHGVTGWKELAFGSIAEKVVRLAHSPVLVLRAPPGPKH